MLEGEERSVYDVDVDRKQLRYVLKLDWNDAIRSLVNAMSL